MGRTPGRRPWHAALAPLEALAIERIVRVAPRLPAPIRAGEHSQTAFALGLALDWARVAGGTRAAERIGAEVRRLYRTTPRRRSRTSRRVTTSSRRILGEADLMRRVLDRADYGAWLDRFLPDVGLRHASRRWLDAGDEPGSAPTASSSHLDGLNLSRAWMLEGVASAVDGGAARAATLREAVQRHAEVGLAAVTGEHYAGAHWLGSFAVYLLTGRGLG